MIHICYSLHDKDGNYSKLTAASIYSVLNNTKESVCVHLLHDSSINEAIKNKFRRVIKKFNQTIRFYNMEKYPSTWERIKVMAEYFHPVSLELWSYAAYYRLFVYEVIPVQIQRIIYLDSDVIANMDINILWQQECPGGFGAVIDIPVSGALTDRYPSKRMKGTIEDDKYFNSGVLVLDRKGFFIGITEMKKKIIDYLSSDFAIDFPDQDYLNYVYQKKCTYLPYRFNTTVSVDRFYIECGKLESRLYHFAGGAAYKGFDDCYQDLWNKYVNSIDWD